MSVAVDYYVPNVVCINWNVHLHTAQYNKMGGLNYYLFTIIMKLKEYRFYEFSVIHKGSLVLDVV